MYFFSWIIEFNLKKLPKKDQKGLGQRNIRTKLFSVILHNHVEWNCTTKNLGAHHAEFLALPLLLFHSLFKFHGTSLYYTYLQKVIAFFNYFQYILLWIHTRDDSSEYIQVNVLLHRTIETCWYWNEGFCPNTNNGPHRVMWQWFYWYSIRSNWTRLASLHCLNSARIICEN